VGVMTIENLKRVAEQGGGEKSACVADPHPF
jgi:hypothetical protein